MESKSTPGPWKISENKCDIEQDSESMFGICTMYADESSMANARLIAAAPDLLEACEAMIEMYKAMMDKIDHGSSFYDAKTIRLMNEAPGLTSKAIAKATS